jgi:hypothetical protein
MQNGLSIYLADRFYLNTRLNTIQNPSNIFKVQITYLKLQLTYLHISILSRIFTFTTCKTIYHGNLFY